MQELYSSVTHIVHLAWQLGFNLSVKPFEDQTAGVRTLLWLASKCSGPKGARFIFSSSVVRVTKLAVSDVRESDLPLSAAQDGYDQSNAVAERII